MASGQAADRSRQADQTESPPSDFAIPETGYWNPAIVTGKDGQATVTFTMPGQSTAWTMVARGITAETLVGETSSGYYCCPQGTLRSIAVADGADRWRPGRDRRHRS